jgi:restriction system protein
MSIPDYQSIMLPLLQYVRDENEHSLGEAIDALADKFNLADTERSLLLPSGQQAIFDNRVAWARTYLKKAGLLESTRRGYFKITQRGLQVVSQDIQRIDARFLRQFPEFVEFQSPKKEPGEEEAPADSTPEESIENAYDHLRTALREELLRQLKSCSPSMFERIVINLLLKMGYGGSRKDAGQAIGKSGDEGIDGIIKEDRLGLDVIYVQAKRWKDQVGRPEIQKFSGALDGKRAKKGIFMTTSTYSKEARDFVSGIDKKIVLLDGQEIAGFMLDHDVGVTLVASYEIKRLDADYFVEE